MPTNIADLLFQVKKICQIEQEYLCDQTKISASQINCLLSIPDEGKLSCGEISEAMLLSPSRGSRLIDSLIEKGLVERKHDKNDRRICSIVLTTEGMEMKKQLSMEKLRFENKITAKLSPLELDQVQKGLKLLLSAFAVKE